MPNVIIISLATSASTWVWLPELLVSSAIEYLIEQLWVQRVLEPVTAWKCHVLLERVRISAIPKVSIKCGPSHPYVSESFEHFNVRFPKWHYLRLLKHLSKWSKPIRIGPLCAYIRC